MNKWQDIKTAPRNGGRILCCKQGMLWVLVAYREDDGDGRCFTQGRPCYPTHWMPCPEPPK